MNDVVPTPGAPTPLASLRQLTLVCYILYALSPFNGFTAVVAVIINYVKRDDARGSLYESHFTWQIRTFWWSLLWAVVGGLTVFIGVGLLVWIADTVWVIYRIVRGFLNWNDGKPMPVPAPEHAA